MKVLVFPALLAVAIITKPPKPVTPPATATSVTSVALTTNSPKTGQAMTASPNQDTALSKIQPETH
ncbi:hypothetical protein J7E24_04185 [Hymenobacter sp. ISL-91]|uniref:hypothetical protein n=1 Tax=Hymenobacter sp. ISL-91 TaxID=2819151 RepID=UPI001BEAA81C|nr:hypothetical protein [Hymenobacter sp. ISL-91]MBT2556971.1 hypothetical protein [Hymenobacter sp. ISL-91]